MVLLLGMSSTTRAVCVWKECGSKIFLPKKRGANYGSLWGGATTYRNLLQISASLASTRNSKLALVA